MKITPARAAAFLRDPGTARVALLYGENEGLVRHRADALTLAVVGAADDPFRIAWLAAADHGRLPEEASAIAMLGGRRVVRVRDAGDLLAPAIAQIMAAPGDSLVLLEAAALPKRSKLLGLVEAAPNGASLVCYPEDAAGLRNAIAGGLQAAGVRADPDALAWLVDHLGSDYASTRGEIEKLVLYAGAEKRLDLDAARACVGDQAATSMDDAAYAATLGDVALADLSVERAFAEGTAAVAILRVLLGHMVKLHQVRGRMEAGSGAAEAVKGLRPPVFWKREQDMIRSAERWPGPRVAAAIEEVRRAELACKQTGAPDAVLVRRLVLALARQANRR